MERLHRLQHSFRASNKLALSMTGMLFILEDVEIRTLKHGAGSWPKENVLVRSFGES